MRNAIIVALGLVCAALVLSGPTAAQNNKTVDVTGTVESIESVDVCSEESFTGGEMLTPDVSCIPAEDCCKICSKGKACGDSCIRRSYECHKGRGCACNSDEVCED